MSGERTLEAPDHAKAEDRESREDLSFWLVALLHLLPGALLMGGVLVLAPPLIERGVPYEIAHNASALLTMVPFMFGAMLLYGRIRHGHFTLRGWCASAGTCRSGSTRRSTCRCSPRPSRSSSPRCP